ncbi:response regulator [Altericroceibacterium indicum]|nr:response regulator [Altericroceibacterium indicum]
MAVTHTGLDDLPVEQRLEIMARRLNRAQNALIDAESVLDKRMRELDLANRELQRREEDLAQRLTIENAKLLYAQRTAGMATIHWQSGESYSSSDELVWLLGIDPEKDVTVESGVSVLHPLDKARVFKAYYAFMHDLPASISHEFDHRIIHPGRGIRWLRWSLRRELDEDGSLQSIYGSVRDITNSRKAERQVKALQLRAERRVRELNRTTRQLEIAKSQAEEALQARDRFLSAVGHHLRTPLASLTGSLEVLAIDAHTQEEKRRIDVASRSAGQLSAMIGELLEEAEGTRPAITLHPIAINAHNALRETQRYWQELHPTADNLSLTISPTVPEGIMADPENLRELSDCLIGSALDSGSHVTVLADWDEGLAISITVQDQGQWANLAKSKKASIGDPAMRFAKRLTERMDGSITIKEPGILHLHLPLLEAPLTGQNGRKSDHLRMPSGRIPIILLAEDTPTNRYVISSQVESLGCHIETVENGALAVERLKEKSFDAVLMDVMMPVMDGETATRTIRELDGPPAHVPIIGITAHSLHAERERLLAAGMTACLSKPVRRDALRFALEEVLQNAPDIAAEAPVSVLDKDAFCQAFTALPASYRSKLLDAVCDDLTTYGKELSDAVEAKDHEAVRHCAHSLKGVALNIGAEGLLDCLELFRKQEIALATSFQPQLKKMIAATVTACGDLFEQHIAEHPAA